VTVLDSSSRTCSRAPWGSPPQVDKIFSWPGDRPKDAVSRPPVNSNVPRQLSGPSPVVAVCPPYITINFIVGRFSTGLIGPPDPGSRERARSCRGALPVRPRWVSMISSLRQKPLRPVVTAPTNRRSRLDCGRRPFATLISPYGLRSPRLHARAVRRPSTISRDRPNSTRTVLEPRHLLGPRVFSIPIRLLLRQRSGVLDRLRVRAKSQVLLSPGFVDGTLFSCGPVVLFFAFPAGSFLAMVLSSAVLGAGLQNAALRAEIVVGHPPGRHTRPRSYAPGPALLVNRHSEFGQSARLRGTPAADGRLFRERPSRNIAGPVMVAAERSDLAKRDPPLSASSIFPGPPRSAAGRPRERGSMVADAHSNFQWWWMETGFPRAGPSSGCARVQLPRRQPAAKRLRPDLPPHRVAIERGKCVGFDGAVQGSGG